MKTSSCLMLLPLLLLAACSRPEPPEKERRPEPQATALPETAGKPPGDA